MWVNNIGNDCRVTGGYWIPSDRPYETILEIVAPRACTHSPCGYQVAWPFRGCGGNWRKIRPPLPPNRFDFRPLISRPSFQYCRRTFAYCSLIFFFQKSREGVYRFTTQAQLTSTSHRSSRNTSRGSSNLSVSNSIHVRLPRTQEWPSWYSSPWGKFPAACWSAESWKRNVQSKFKVTTRLELLEGTLADAWNYCPWAKGGIDQFSHSPRS